MTTIDNPPPFKNCFLPGSLSVAGWRFDLPWMLSPCLRLRFWEDSRHCPGWRDVGLISGPLCGCGAPEWSCYTCLGLAGKLGLLLLWRPHRAQGRGSFQGDLLPPKHQLSVVGLPRSPGHPFLGGTSFPCKPLRAAHLTYSHIHTLNMYLCVYICTHICVYINVHMSIFVPCLLECSELRRRV